MYRYILHVFRTKVIYIIKYKSLIHSLLAHMGIAAGVPSSLRRVQTARSNEHDSSRKAEAQLRRVDANRQDCIHCLHARRSAPRELANTTRTHTRKRAHATNSELGIKLPRA